MGEDSQEIETEIKEECLEKNVKEDDLQYVDWVTADIVAELEE